MTSRLILPPEKRTPNRQQFKTHVFSVGYYRDLMRFLKLVDDSGAELASVFRPFRRLGIGGGFVIAYEFDEELGMEVWT